MRLLLAVFAALLFFGVLWGPALAVALRCWRRGQLRPLWHLRFLCPAQLIAAVTLAFAGDALGWRHPAALAVASTVCVSLVGAAGLALLARLARR